MLADSDLSSTSYVKGLHAALLRNQETHTDTPGKHSKKKLEKGKYKSVPNSPARPDGTIHEYCPQEHVDSEMGRRAKRQPRILHSHHF